MTRRVCERGCGSKLATASENLLVEKVRRAPEFKTAAGWVEGAAANHGSRPCADGRFTLPRSAQVPRNRIGSRPCFGVRSWDADTSMTCESQSVHSLAAHGDFDLDTSAFSFYFLNYLIVPFFVIPYKAHSN